MVEGDAAQITEGVTKSGKILKTVMISHAHPDHFTGLEVITERFPKAQVVSTANVVADIRQDGPWMLSLLQGELGPQGPKRLVVPEILAEPSLDIEGSRLDVVEFGEGESKHKRDGLRSAFEGAAFGGFGLPRRAPLPAGVRTPDLGDEVMRPPSFDLSGVPRNPQSGH